MNEVIIFAEFEPVISENVARLREALKRARSLRQSLRMSSVDGIYEHVEDVDGDWLENWTDEDILLTDEAASDNTSIIKHE